MHNTVSIYYSETNPNDYDDKSGQWWYCFQNYAPEGPFPTQISATRHLLDQLVEYNR